MNDKMMVRPGDPFGLRLLHASPQPLIDIIFVHGLRGGSSKTWRKGDDVRSDWGSLNPSVLNVHDFWQALYEELRSSPNLRQIADSPIVMIGHSMGGLVIKKAYILAHQDQVHHHLAERIRCIFFLATPHRGSEYASVLNRILKISGVTGMASSREYIGELSQWSTSAQIINGDFGRYASSLEIYSFYETLETNLGFSSSLIVDKDSAVLGPGFKNEIARYMNATHRGICKFDSPEDPNYISLKNSLASAVDSLLHELAHDATAKAQPRKLQTVLGVSGPQYENDFREWRDAAIDIDPNKNGQYAPAIYWVNANPGAGKTVLASHVFYHFHVGKKASHSLAGCLRSMAFQMASLNSVIRVTLSNLNDGGAKFDLDDARAIWLKIFKAAILQTPRVTAQYWIFDAVDECLGYPELFTFLKGLRILFPLKILITSRKLPDFPKPFRQLDGYSIHVIEIPTIDTMRDISLFVRDRMEVLPIDKEEDKENLAKEILSKSNASFLWVRLVLDELEGVYGYESIMSVLHSIPEGMMSYYRRTLAEMKANKWERHIIQGILKWVLTEALRIDINVHLPSARTAVEGLCGQLVVHTTAREISRPEANERLAFACLQLLGSPAMQPPRHRRLLAQKRQEQPSSPLLDYAITQFSEHILALNRFLCTTVLNWIERIVTGKNLHFLIMVARKLKEYLDRRAKYRSPLNRHVNTLVTKFGATLVSQPQSIYFLIPPLCPNETAVYKQFGRSADGLKISGFTNQDWDDSATVTCDDRSIAVGFEVGNIQLYVHGSYQKGLIIRHAHPIERLFLDRTGAFIVSASTKYITVWDVDGNMLWQQRLRSRCILLTATSSVIICVMMSGKAIPHNILTGEQVEHHHYPHQAPESLDQLSTRPTKAPYTGNATHLVFNPNPDVNLLLVAYDDSHLSLYEPWSGTFVHSQQPETNAGNLRIWDFESLTVLYHVLTPTSSFRTLNFTSDGFNLLDVVDQEMRIWAPATLIRKTIEEEGSISDQASILPVTAGQYESFRSGKLRAATLGEHRSLLVAWNHSGDVIIHDQDGYRSGILYSHSHSVVKCLALSKGDDIASSDTNGVVQVWQLDTSQLPVTGVAKQRFRTQLKTAVRQLLFDDEGRYLLVSTTDSDRVYEVATGKIVGSLSFRTDERQIWRWVHLPASTAAGRFVLVCDDRVISYPATTFPSEVVGSEVKLELKADPGFTLTAIDSIAIHLETPSLVLDVSQSRGYLTSSILLVFQIPELFDPTQPATHVQTPRLLSSHWHMHFLGVDQADCRIVFLHKNLWVCSVKFSELDRHLYTRHFFVPHEFTTRTRDIHPLFRRDKALILALHEKFAVIKNGLVFQEVVTGDGD
ncbi:NACHT and WD domain protein [Xylaria telfairii]|nr:NACHT and WD domain protein [Xylaria telfairii]